MSIYGATKAFVLFLSQGLNLELSPKGVYVQAVLPAATRTEIWERAGIDVNSVPRGDGSGRTGRCRTASASTVASWSPSRRCMSPSAGMRWMVRAKGCWRTCDNPMRLSAIGRRSEY